MSDFTQLSRKDWILLAENFNQQFPYEECSKFTTQEWNRRTPYIGWRVRDVLVNITRAKVVNFWQLLDRAEADNPIAPEEFDTFLRGEHEMVPRKDLPISQIL